MTTVHVSLGERSYDIRIGAGILDQEASWMVAALKLSHAVIVADRSVSSFADRLVRGLAGARVRADLIVVPSGETSKSIEQLERLWNAFQSAGADRQSVIVAVGGGVIGDLAGFAAASYMRGLRFVQVPTTLLAQVDSSVGGKTGINLAAGKNLVGAFWQPAGVCIDTQTLHGLPDREFRSGLAEVVKYGVIGDPDLFARLEAGVPQILARDSDALAQVIADCCRAKARVVEQDEFERTGVRASLNYGHTFAHAFERVYGYGNLLHGEAVSMGMTCAARLAAELGLWSADETARQEQLLRRLGLPVWLTPTEIEPILEAMSKDKKVAHGRLKFVLPTRLGSVRLVDDVDMSRVKSVLQSAMCEG